MLLGKVFIGWLAMHMAGTHAKDALLDLCPADCQDDNGKCSYEACPMIYKEVHGPCGCA